MNTVVRSARRWRALIAALALAACGGGEAVTPPGGGGPPPSPPGGGTSTSKSVTVTIALDQDRAAISPLIYGTNQDAGQSFWTIIRNGGNRTTGYNWENNFSNAGNDYLHNSDLFNITNWGLPASDARIPGRAVTYGHSRSVAMGAQSIVTLQLAGYVAADGNGPVTPAQAAPSPRWAKVEYKKPTPLTTTPDLTDGVVYMDEQVNLFVKEFGAAGSPSGIRYYSLDNEPAIWSSTHARIHPQQVGGAELLTRSIALATAVKAVDPAAQILGPSEYGIQGYFSLQSAPDWPALKGSFDWYLDYYLDGMKKAEQAAGKRLLDVLDVHWYPEARGDNRIVDGGATTAKDATARLQAPRTLWDATYREDSWVQQALPSFLPILPRLQRSIAQYYPGTKLAITEYDFGGKNTISGGLAQADVLGTFAQQGVFIATMWGLGANDQFAIAGFKLYRDYDALKSTFGNTHVRATSADPATASVYASIESADASVVHVVLLNKSGTDSLTAKVQLTGGTSLTGGQVWGFGGASAQITARPAIAGIVNNSFDYAVPPLTAVHIVLRK
ncbi:MAG: glycoside hydrolase family 44 protein [Gemmatimonadaceae bacterium]